MNEEIVDVLCVTDISTLRRSLEARDKSLIRLTDGTEPTDEQIALIMQAGPEHFDAAQKEMRARAIRAENAVFPAERIAGLMEKYESAPGETLGVVAQRMNPEDQEELASLLPWLAEGEGEGHGDCSS